MNSLTKIALVAGSYLLACLATYGILFVNQALTQNAAAQASAGMSAFGDLLLFVGVFGILALFPTGLGLYFLIKRFKT
jgi:hypothetical protein